MYVHACCAMMHMCGVYVCVCMCVCVCILPCIEMILGAAYASNRAAAENT